jgi:hypothetical protein
MIITSTGEVGIGTSIPVSILHIDNCINNEAAISLTQNGGRHGIGGYFSDNGLIRDALWYLGK